VLGRSIFRCISTTNPSTLLLQMDLSHGSSACTPSDRPIGRINLAPLSERLHCPAHCRCSSHSSDPPYRRRPPSIHEGIQQLIPFGPAQHLSEQVTKVCPCVFLGDADDLRRHAPRPLWRHDKKCCAAFWTTDNTDSGMETFLNTDSLSQKTSRKRHPPAPRPVSRTYGVCTVVP
jgi:hypothetical protein